MQLKKFHLVLLLLIGFLLSPALSFACGEKGYDYNKETSAKGCAKECCKEKKQSQPNGEHKECKGKCGHSSCHCPTFSGIGFALIPKDGYNFKFADCMPETLQFGYTETAFKSAINSLRLPPKIG